jgi:hypothetical protein
VTRFADGNRFATWTGTAPIEASSGEHVRHRLSRAGNRRMNHMIHIAAATQIRLDTEGRRYYRRKLAQGKTRMEAMRCLKRRISDALYRQLLVDARAAEQTTAGTGPRGTAGRLFNPARSTYPRTSTLRISTSRTRAPDATTPIESSEEHRQATPQNHRLTTEGSYETHPGTHQLPRIRMAGMGISIRRTRDLELHIRWARTCLRGLSLARQSSRDRASGPPGWLPSHPLVRSLGRGQRCTR